MVTELGESNHWHLAHKQHLGAVCALIVHILIFSYKIDNKGDNFLAWVLDVVS